MTMTGWMRAVAAWRKLHPFATEGHVHASAGAGLELVLHSLDLRRLAGHHLEINDTGTRYCVKVPFNRHCLAAYLAIVNDVVRTVPICPSANAQPIRLCPRGD